jgi:hypothetical protein
MLLSFAASARRTRYRWGGAAALAVTIALLTAPTAASADPAPATNAAPASSPAPDATSTPAAPTQPAVTAPRAAPAAAPFSRYPVIDIIPIYTTPQFVISPTTTKPVVTNALINTKTGYDNLDVGGTVKIPITPIVSAAFDRVVEGTVNVPNARVTTATGAYTYPTFSRDSVLVYRLDENYKRFQLEEGLYFRHRIVGGTNTSNTPFPNTVASQEAHYAYVGLTYSTPPIRFLLNSFFTLNINGDAQTIDHHVGCTGKIFTSGNFTAPCVNGVFDPDPGKNRDFETDQYVQLTVPIDRKHGWSAVAQDRWGALNFYENAAFPYRWTTSQTYLLTHRFNRVFALSFRLRDQWSVKSGAPYVYPNSQHNGTVDVLADFKIDTNTFH